MRHATPRGETRPQHPDTPPRAATHNNPQAPPPTTATTPQLPPAHGATPSANAGSVGAGVARPHPRSGSGTGTGAGRRTANGGAPSRPMPSRKDLFSPSTLDIARSVAFLKELHQYVLHLCIFGFVSRLLSAASCEGVSLSTWWWWCSPAFCLLFVCVPCPFTGWVLFHHSLLFWHPWGRYWIQMCVGKACVCACFCACLCVRDRAELLLEY